MITIEQCVHQDQESQRDRKLLRVWEEKQKKNVSLKTVRRTSSKLRKNQRILLQPLMSGEATSEERIGCSIIILLNVWLFRGIELTDDILHIIFSYLQLKDRIRVERGINNLAWSPIILICYDVISLLVCRQWYGVARQWWKSAKSIHFQNTFRKFKSGKFSSYSLVQ